MGWLGGVQGGDGDGFGVWMGGIWGWGRIWGWGWMCGGLGADLGSDVRWVGADLGSDVRWDGADLGLGSDLGSDVGWIWGRMCGGSGRIWGGFGADLGRIWGRMCGGSGRIWGGFGVGCGVGWGGFGAGVGCGAHLGLGASCRPRSVAWQRGGAAARSGASLPAGLEALRAPHPGGAAGHRGAVRHRAARASIKRRSTPPVCLRRGGAP